jgi:GGDEF domain-containing protein
MVENSVTGQMNDDPRRLRALLARASDLAQAHSVTSVMIGLAAVEGDLIFPEFADFLQSALRVEDGIFRMTRERLVVHLADLDRGRAQDVVDRLIANFCDEYPATECPAFEARFFEVKPGSPGLRVRDVLTEIFSSRTLH